MDYTKQTQKHLGQINIKPAIIGTQKPKINQPHEEAKLNPAYDENYYLQNVLPEAQVLEGKRKNAVRIFLIGLHIITIIQYFVFTEVPEISLSSWALMAVILSSNLLVAGFGYSKIVDINPLGLLIGLLLYVGIIGAEFYDLYDQSWDKKQELIGFCFGIMFFSAMALWIFAFPARRYMILRKLKVHAPIFKYFSDLTYVGKVPYDVMALSHFGIIPLYNQSRTEDFIQGTHHMVHYEAFEAELWVTRKGSRTNSKKILFEGSILKLTFPMSLISGHIIIKKRCGSTDDWLIEQPLNLQEVSFEDPLITKAFRIFSQDKNEAKFFLPQSLLLQLLRIQEAARSEGISCAFQGNQVLLMTDTLDNRFETSLLEMNDNIKEVNQIIQELNDIKTIIDHFIPLVPGTANHQGKPGSLQENEVSV